MQTTLQENLDSPKDLCETLSIFSRSLPFLTKSLIEQGIITEKEDPINVLIKTEFLSGMSYACQFLNWNASRQANRRTVENTVATIFDPAFFHTQCPQLFEELRAMGIEVSTEDFEEWAMGFMLVRETYNLMSQRIGLCDYSCQVGS
ncbi:hypothetical protein GW755_00735 [bacterium]|nr:hypothetical protein [bacterium]